MRITGRRWTAAAITITVLAAAACSAEPEDGAPSAQSSTTISVRSPAPTPPPTPVRLSVPMYQRALTNVEKILRTYVFRVMNAKTVPAFDAARAQLAAVVVRERQVLAKVNPPKALDAAHETVLRAFDGYPDIVTDNLSGARATRTSCGLPKAPATRLYEAKTGIRSSVLELTQDVSKSVGKGFRFGALVVPPAPKAPPEVSGRGTNGKIVQRSGARGPGRLRIDNGSSSDVVIVVTNSNPRRPQVSIYVRANQKATLSGIRGSYYVYFKSGTGWDAANRRFTEDCAYERYDDRFDGKFDWSISLARTPLGNASTSEVGAF
ncbi:hypothetical protein E1218_32375 [Kribbella turkmenica]|uniref:Uncharacterized protein n=1 Tax=Kribbella turkmenica TaxID=2530375 RepID=A0A4R4W861_9ACTN|nr:hypothetical protein [Kribbella turkmenica]TDD14889.1 hypothetical protein E1218_32375 [Kribbella turkmenica]